jgi:hypothetical protein
MVFMARHPKSMLFISIFLLACMIVAGKAGIAKATNAATGFLFDLDMQLNVYSIDLKTETLYSQYYHFEMRALDPAVSSFYVVVLQPDYYGGMGIGPSWNVSGSQQVNYSINSDRPDINAWRFHLNPIHPLLGGTPWDQYDLSFLIAVNVSTQLNVNNCFVWMPAYLQGQWAYSEDIAAQKLAAQPSNESLVSLGLSPQKFYQYGCNNMTDFYLFTIALSFPQMNSLRMIVAFLLPSLAILGMLVVTTIYRNRLKRADFLAIFVGAGLFTLSFLVSFYQFAPPDVFTWEELMLIVDFVFATGLAVYSVVRRDETEPDEKSGTQPQKDHEKQQEQGPRLVEIGTSIDKAFEWFVLLMSVLIGILFGFLTWVTKPEANLNLTAKFMFSMTAPLVLAICTWLWYLLTLSKERQIYLRLCSWSIISMIFAYYIMLFSTFVVLGITGQFGLTAAAALLSGSVIAGLFPLKRIARAYKAMTPENEFWNRKYAPVAAYLWGVSLGGVLVLLPFVFP